ncbi:MAG TPA: amidohydrolase, partial [Tissierellaceae bacterium]|nr:amidohydrolase [Tissierellaceae bacterium]
SIEDYLIDMRRYFHMNPELSWEEYETSKKIQEELEDMGIEYEVVLETGIIGTIVGNKQGPIIGIRADIDALPVNEETGLEFSSKNEGKMHACGHDAHTAMLLTTGKLLKEMKDELGCIVKLIFQPAEEFIEDSGAEYMSELDELKDLDSIVALHIWSDIESGLISVNSGPRLASADTFEIEVIGKGGHGAMPHGSVDPVMMSAALISNLQTLASREYNPMDTFVLSVCTLDAGTVPNIIPEKVIMEGTTRTFNDEVRDLLEGKMERVIENTVKTFRGDYKFKYNYGTPATINNELASKVAERAVVNALGEEYLYDYPATMGGEDFAKFLQKVPGCFGFLGGRNEEKDQSYAHHNPKFDVDEDAMKNGVAFFIQYVLEMQEELKNK